MLKVSAYNTDNQKIGAFRLNTNECYGLRKGNMDLLKVCATWIPQIRRLKIVNP